ncbi:FBD-associated F-box protein At5g27750-like isoform X2 [Humulus lupulus]|uniref:FBD-associated F-box protein At5g27750-like isoform X2 n=1 Tax=Humulus lupulus TaxID=3486 RepID=UPI002B40D767|nr:FBD-associated F-box protein At5g27750-like isoform X2 [Humulus lupulus]
MNENGDDETIDRISNLPEVLIHQILSSVPAVDVVRMSVLSRRWKRMWYSDEIPTMQFCDSLGFSTPRAFEIFMLECLRRRHRHRHNNDHSIHTQYKFQLQYPKIQTAVLTRVMRSTFIWDNVVEFDLSESPAANISHMIMIPLYIFTGKSLTLLKLKSVHVHGLNEDDLLAKMLLGSPVLEEFVLKSLQLSNTCISSSSLKFLEIYGYSRENLRVDATNLQSFQVRGALHDKIIIDITHFSSLRNLSINTACDNIDDNFLEHLISKLPLIEHLSLCHCYFLKHITIRSNSLTSFAFGKVHSAEVRATMETPNLLSFSYKGDLEFGMTIISPPNDQLNGTFVISGTLPNDQLILGTSMVHFLISINCPWKILSLEAQSEQVFLFPEEFKRRSHRPLTNLKHLKIKTFERLEDESKLKDSLYWVSPHLETLLIEEGTESELMLF